jgi:hypothetical protein
MTRLVLARWVVAAAVVALAASPAAFAKASLTFSRASAHIGQRATILVGRNYGPRPESGRVYDVYLVRASRMGEVMYADGGAGPRRGPPPRRVDPALVGHMPTTGRSLTFRVPKVSAGRYAAVLFCPRCRDPELVGSVATGIPDGTPPPQPGSLLTIRR